MPIKIPVIATSEYGRDEVRISMRVDPDAQLRTVELRA
jgi:hypothetical protein